MRFTRRDFLRTGTSAAAVTALVGAPRPLLAQLGGLRPEPVPPIDDPRLKGLVSRGLDVARSAGAAYADVRLSHTRVRIIAARADGADDLQEREVIGVGVRALVDGYWGFASGPAWNPDEMARLGREAVHQARTNTLGGSREVELAPAPAVPDGHWAMPVRIDPFAVSPLELIDQMSGLMIFLLGAGAKPSPMQTILVMQDKAFGSTDGSYCTQRLYRTAGSLWFTLERQQKKMTRALDLLSPAGMGWELFRDQPLREELRRQLAELEEDLALPIKPVDVGRYPAAFDAASVASLVKQTVGPATELDRALGYEANAGGTSYLTDPLGMLGSFQAGAPSLTITANRSEPGGCATVKWDDEGVEPDEFALVKDGILADFQTTRESAGWLKDAYAKAGKPFRSHGCSAAPSAVDATLQHAPNLVMAPGPAARDFDALVAEIDKGIAVRGAQLDMDFQHSSGLGIGLIYEVKGGKRTAILGNAGFLFRATELWKGLGAVGGANSVRRYGMPATKGEPGQEHYASVTAPAAAFDNVTVIDPRRKA